MATLLQITQDIDIMSIDKLCKKQLQDELKTHRAIERITRQRIRDIEKQLADMEKTAAEKDCKMIAESLEQVA
jgi:hypothetical protein